MVYAGSIFFVTGAPDDRILRPMLPSGLAHPCGMAVGNAGTCVCVPDPRLFSNPIALLVYVRVGEG